MRVKARKRYWLINGVALTILAILTHGIALLVFPFIWMLDKKLAMAAYMREDLDVPPAWYDDFSKWEFEQVSGTGKEN